MKKTGLKKGISFLLCLITVAASLSAFSLSAEAKSYTAQLKAKGFPDSYVSYLTKLHEKYPEWDFEIFDTSLKWSTAVSGERSAHSKQLIEKQSGLSSSYYCSCSSCKKNGKYVAQEGSSWYSASEKAVKYYMDPRNWLTEKYIFQFESTSYDSNQTQSGVESIIASTWMKNANITYTNTSGTQKTYTSSGDKVKYSKAIVNAAKYSGMSAYYLASKIVQEVGSTKNTYASGSAGNKSPFIGIYNYYNIGAYSGGMEGLEWASGFLKTTTSTKLYSSYDSSKKKGSGTTTKLSSGQYMAYISTYGDYYKVRLYYGSSGSYTAGKVGYVKTSDLRTKYFNYSRPWTNPYKSIYYGAAYIANSFSKYQNTGYLQKFNVNKKSGSLYNHEYMANVQAAASESVTTYNAYKKAKILSSAKVFYIPVYDNMPSSPCTMSSSGSSTTTDSSASSSSTKVSGVKLTSRSTSSLTFKWNSVSKATKYYVYVKNNTKNTSFSKTVTSNSAKLNGLTAGNKYTVKVRAYVSGWKSYSDSYTTHTTPSKVSGLKVSSSSSDSVKLKWNKVSPCDGYIVYKYYSSSKKYEKVKTVKGSSNNSCSVASLAAGTTYKFSVCAYVKDSITKKGSRSSIVTVVTKPSSVKISSYSSPSAGKIKISWGKATSNYTGYQIVYSKKSDFSSLSAKKKITDKSLTSYTGKNFTSGETCYVRIRVYRTVGDSTYYGSWSNSVKVKVK